MVRLIAFFRMAMRHAALLPVLALAAAAPATADETLRLAQVYQPYPGSPPVRVYRPIPPHEVVAIVRSLGLNPVQAPRARGSVWLVRASGRDGTLVRVVVDGNSGRVMEIVRLDAPPRMVRVRPGPYEDADDHDNLAPIPPANVPGAWDGPSDGPYPGDAPYRGGASHPGSGPQVITREDIRTRDLPPPGAGQYPSRNAPGAGSQISRESETTGSVPQPVDPLLGVPPEFRRGAKQPGPSQDRRIATRPPADTNPRATPLPRPRPADVPAQANREEPASATAGAGTAASKTPEVTGSTKKPEDFPVQALE